MGGCAPWQALEFVLGGKLRFNQGMRTGGAGRDELAEPMIALRSDDEVDLRCAGNDLVALGLRDTSGDGDDRLLADAPAALL